ncbi:cell division-like protein [Hydrogenovibrio sp. SC-1]|uniref:cell division protein ZipA C-terminal FtsZ-binding domain-containing protein n=1 Tax=Hydrogenovibrio sp. SC-1 TaxID=2065820 RepID=UPI000C7D6492|nr:cell division protein ZipA C-terminal FtsZ-binding domain-containing protein [Hydrogenovibrio sp. SC-1]PLA74167.1 cell division-like protein [Hydrogenovibrio sp. SC-1]
MNELQQVLLIFAMIVIVGLYLLNKAKSKKHPADANQQQTSSQSKGDNSHDLNDLGEAHLPLSEKTQHRLHLDEDSQLEETVPDAQLGLSFGQEFEVHKTAKSQTKSEQVTLAEDRRKPQEIQIESIEEEADESSVAEADPEQETKKETVAVQPTADTKDQPDEKIFALIIMGSEDFVWPKVNQTLQGVGLLPSDSGIFVKNDTMGQELIRVANLLEPGTFPLEEPVNSDHKIAGLVLILTLPTSVSATSVMREMIMMARKISQRLNGRLYDVERHLIKESDLQSMRDAAAQYEADSQ